MGLEGGSSHGTGSSRAGMRNKELQGKTSSTVGMLSGLPSGPREKSE